MDGLVFLMNDCGCGDRFFLFYRLIPSVNNTLQILSQIPMKLIGPQLAFSTLFSIFSLEEPSPISTISQKPQLDFKKILFTNPPCILGYRSSKSRNLNECRAIRWFLTAADIKFPIFVYLFLSKDLSSCQRRQEEK